MRIPVTTQHERHDSPYDSCKRRQPNRTNRFTTFVDFLKAFDSISRSCLWRLLSKYGCPDKFILMLRAFHEGMQAQVMIDGETTDAFPVAHGVKQGCIIAPTMFTLFLAAVLEVSNSDTTKGVYITTRSEGRLFNVSHLKVKTKVRQLFVRGLLYADDTGFVSHSEVDLQTILDGFATAFASFGLSCRYCGRKLAARIGQLSHERCDVNVILGTEKTADDRYVYIFTSSFNSM